MGSKEPQFLYLTTTGRVTGRPREIEIWFVTRKGKYYVLAEHFQNTQWVKNILQNPLVRARVSGREFKAAARVLDPGDDQQIWEQVRQLAREKYGWGEGLPVEIAPL